MATGMDFRGNQWLAKFKAEQKRRMSAACILVSSETKKNLSHAGTALVEVGKTTINKKTGALKHSKGRRLYNFTHSAPGDYPFKQKGQLRRMIMWEVLAGSATSSRTTGRVGTNYLVGKYLELGTRKMKRRPFLGPTLKLHQHRAALILLKQVPPGGLPVFPTSVARRTVMGRGSFSAGAKGTW